MKRFFRGLLPSLVLVGMCSLAASVHAQNLLTNPGFEANGGSFAGWTKFGNDTISTAANDNIMHSGLAAAKLFGGFNGCPFAPSFNVGGIYQSFPLAASSNTTFEFSCRAYISSADSIPGSFYCNSNRAIIKLAFFNATGTEIQGSECFIADPFTVKNRWNSFSVTSDAPAAARSVQALVLYLQPGCAGGAVYVDNLILESHPTQAISGNVLSNPNFSTPGLNLVVPGWTTFGNVYYDGRAFGSYSAGGAVKLFGTFNPGTNSVMYQSFKTSPGTQWEFLVNTLNTCSDSPLQGTNDNNLVAHIAFMGANGVEIAGGPSVNARNVSMPLGNWLNTYVTGVAPAGTDSVRCYLVFEQPTNKGGAVFVDNAIFRTVPNVGVGTTASALSLSSPFPNPSRNNARLSYSLPTTGEISVRVFDVAGRAVATLLQGTRPAGQGSVEWNGRRADGSLAATGIYQVVLRTETASVSRRLVLTH